MYERQSLTMLAIWNNGTGRKVDFFCKSSHHHPSATTAQVFSWNIDKATQSNGGTRPGNAMIGRRSDRKSSQREKKTFLNDSHCPTWLESGDPPHDIAIAL